VSPRPPPSRADQALADEATARGVDVSPRKVERWRQAGWLPTRRRHGLGRGRGSVSDPDPPRVLYQVMAIRLLIDRNVPSRHRAAVLFGDGFDIEVNALRASFAAALRDARQDMRNKARRSSGVGFEEPSDEADAAARLVARKRTRGPWADRKARLKSAGRGKRWPGTMFTLFDLGYTGTTPDEEQTRDLLTALGVTAVEGLDELETFLSATSFDPMERAIRKATLPDFMRARKVYDDFMEFIRRLRLSSPDDETIAGLDDLQPFELSDRAIGITLILTLFHRAAIQ
jgi:hypothetical protein